MSGIGFSGTYATPRIDLGRALMEYRHEGPEPEFVANQVLPLLPTRVKAGNYPRIRRETLLDNPDTKRSVGGDYNRGEFEAEDGTFACENFGSEQPLDDSERLRFMSDFDAEMVALMHAERRVRIAREIRVAAAIFNTTTWTGDPLYTDVSSAPWDTASSDWITHVINAVEKVRQNSGMRANALILTASQFVNLLKNDKTIARFPGAPDITIQMVADTLAKICGIERMIIGGAVYNSAKKGATAVISNVWSDDYAMVARVARDGEPIDAPSIGRTFLWTPYSAEEYVAEQYREESKESDIFRVKNFLDEVVVLPECGHLLKID